MKAWPGDVMSYANLPGVTSVTDVTRGVTLFTVRQPRSYAPRCRGRLRHARRCSLRRGRR